MSDALIRRAGPEDAETLTQLMVERDFNLGQVGLIVAARGAQAAVSRSRALIFCRECEAHA